MRDLLSVVIPESESDGGYAMAGRGRILKYKSGYNPNSSSIGTNLTPLLLIGGALAVLLPVVGFFIARRLKKKKGE